MAEFFGAGATAGTVYRIPNDDPAWRFYNRYVGEPSDAEPHVFTTRREANDMALYNLFHFGHRRIGLVIVKKPPAQIFAPGLPDG